MLLRKLFTSTMLAVRSNILGFLAPLIVPPLHICFVYYFWKDFNRVVDKQYCSCSCWDTVFKGTYESGIASYKHMYFNATTNTLKIWATIVLGIILFYEVTKHLAWLCLEGRLRSGMFLLFLSAVFSHYYSWWVYINYWNDDFYSQWYHQLIFSATEFISTLMVIHLADEKNTVTRRKAFVIVGIALSHIFAAGWDQFITNVVRGEGSDHQVIRDVGFMIPDILHVVVPLCFLRTKDYCLPGAGIHDSEVNRDLICMFSTVFIGLCILSIF